MKYLTKIEATQGVDFSKSEMLNATVQNLAAAPSSPVEGQIYFDTVAHRLFAWNGTAWIGADAVGATMSAADILTAVKTVDGTTSGLDADLLDGVHASSLVSANGAITGASKTKITYDAKGLVTAGADATTADIADSADKRYCTDAQKTVIGNTSGVNSGDQSKGTPAVTLGTTNVAGSAATFLATDATIAVFDATVPVTQAFGDAAAVGSASAAARRDHKHAMPAAPTIPTGAAPALTLGTANAAGSAATFVKTDATLLAFDATVPATQAFGDSAAVGAATVAARRDHKHAMPAAPTLGGLGGVATTVTVNGHALSSNVSVTQTDVGLSAVTNNAQVKKAASSTDGYIPKWSGTAGDAIVDGYSVETSLSGASTALPRADAVKTYIDNLLASNDAMLFKGTLGVGGTITALPTTYNIGWTWRVITAATYAGVVAEVGDLFIAIADRAGSGNVNADWTVVQTNDDGGVTGPASATADRFASFNGTSGKIIKDSGYSSASFVPAAHTTGHIAKYTTTCGTSASWTVTHNLGTQDVAVTIKDVATQAVVYADVVMTSANVVTVTFAVAPTAAQYSITIIG